MRRVKNIVCNKCKVLYFMSDNNLTVNQKFKIKLVSGLIGSITSVVVCSPLDLIKVRVQVSVITIYNIFKLV